MGTNCPHKETCYRYTANPCEYWQAYFTEPPIKDGKCDMYWGKNSEAVWNQLKRNNQMSNYTYLGKFIKTPGDLAPKGVRSTYQNEKLSFNETFEKIWEQINIKK
jgi:hypothetical protein